MVKKNLWRDLAVEFRALRDSHGTLQAHWYIDDGGSKAWKVWDPAGGTATVRFEALAKRGALALSQAGGSGDPLSAWLDILSARAAISDLTATESRKMLTKSVDKQRPGGKILRICEASADYCTALESHALDAESLQEQQEDPRNWSVLHRQVATHMKLKQIRGAPAEEIPEEFVRAGIAEQYGVKPEEVTAKQMRNEVAGLLRRYPGIKLTAPPTGDGQEEGKAPGVSQSTESMGQQIDRYRQECRMTVEEFAAAVSVTTRTVQRHMAGTRKPLARHLSGYERLFSKLLKRRIVIEKRS
jgi:hypothetical protein